MAQKSDVLIIGGGATGTGLARDLSLRGVDVTLVERGTLCSGTTGRSHCTLHSGARYATDHPRQARECLEENQILHRIASHCVERTGGLYVSLPSDPDDYVDEQLEACRAVGIEATEIPAEAAREREPAIAPTIERAFCVPDGVVYPSRLTAANAASAQRAGARIRTRTAVTDIRTDDDRITAVELESNGETETVRPAHVVNAAGAWAGQLGEMAGVPVSMRPSKGALIAVDTNRVDRVVSRARPPSDADSVVPTGTELLLGTSSSPVADPDAFTRESTVITSILEESAELVPEIASSRVTRTFWGVRPLYSPTERDDTRSISRSITLLDHAERDGLGGFTTIVGGKLTTYRKMAELAADHVCDRLGVSTACRTADEPLPGHDDPAKLDSYVRQFAASAPADGGVARRELRD